MSKKFISSLLSVFVGLSMIFLSCSPDLSDISAQTTGNVAESGGGSDNSPIQNGDCTEADGDGSEEEDFSEDFVLSRVYATAKSATSVSVDWTLVNGVEHYEIAYCRNPSEDLHYENVRPEEPPYTIRGLESGTLYYFYVRAVDDAFGIKSNWKFATCRTKESEPSAVPVITSIDFSDDKKGLCISWNPVVGAKYYNVYWAKSVNSISGYRKVNENSGIFGTTVTDDEAPIEEPETCNSYRITAVYSNGTESAMSEPKSVTVGYPVVKVSGTSSVNEGSKKAPKYRHYRNFTAKIDGLLYTGKKTLPAFGEFTVQTSYSKSTTTNKSLSSTKGLSWSTTKKDLGIRQFRPGFIYEITPRNGNVNERSNITME